MPDYGEIFCTAVNEIVKQQLGQIKFDLTKDCTVVSVQNKKNFEYLVSDGSNTFKAYATAGVTYAEGDQVMVSIPEGDYSKQKTIINKIVSDSSSIGYKDPLEDFIAGSGNIIQIADVNKLTANGVDVSGKPVAIKRLFTLNDSQSNLYFGFTKLALSAEFMTLLDNLGVITGQYGLKLLITDASGASSELTFSASKMLGNPYAFNTYFKQVCVFDLPESIKDIQKIELLFYQDGNFTTDGRTLISNQLGENILVKNINVILGFSSSAATSEEVTISANNMSYSFNDNVRYPTLQWFHLIDTGVFEPISSSNWEEKKDYCEIRWYQYEPGCAEGDTDEYGGVNWYWLNQPGTLVGMPANYPFSYPIALSPNNDYEKIKVVALYTTFPLQNDPDYKQTFNYTSNILEFQNNTETSNGGTQTEDQIVEDLSLFFTDNSYGNYFWYDQNGSLIDLANQGSAIPRTVEIRAKGATLDSNWESYDLIDWIKWEMPMDDDSTMILPAKNMEFFNPTDNILDLLNKDGLSLEEKKQYCHPGDFHFKTKINFGASKSSVNKVKIILETYVNGSWDAPGNRPLSATITTSDEQEKEFYTVFKIKHTYDDLRIKYEYYKDNVKVSSISPIVSETELKQTSSFIASTKTKEDGISMYYSIKNQWTQNRDNNTIRCTISINGTPYILTETLRFGVKGSSGTANTFLLEMLDGKNALTIGNDDNGVPNQLRVQAILIGGNGKRIALTSNEANSISWTLINGNSSYMSLNNTSGEIVTLTANTGMLPTNNYAILQAKYKYSNADEKSGSKPWLYAFLPIPLKTKNCIGMQGTTQIIYNHQGTPKYSDTPYIAYCNSGEESDLEIQENTSWILIQPKNSKNIITNPNPINLIEGPILRATALYSKKDDDDDIIQDKACMYCTHWSQPILIMQSQYDFALLNEWNGELMTDEENGIILATMLGAGKKNSDNQFSGVLIGDIKNGTDLEDTEKMTGVYGFDDGVMSYALREDGTAFFGAKKNGRIEVDGEHGAIHSYGWTPEYRASADGTNKWTKWTLSDSTKGSVFDLDDGQLQLYTDEDNYLKYNNDNSGILEMALSGTNIKLNDKTNNPSLSAYIDANAKRMVIEYRRTATYAVICKTADGAAEKLLNIEDFQREEDFKSDNADEANEVTEITVDDILQNGVTIAVTFTDGETVEAEPKQTKEEHNTGRSNPIHTGSKIQYTGQALFLSIGENKRPIWINNKATNSTSSLMWDEEDKQWVKNENSNYFGWVAGSTVYFVYTGTKDSGHWAVTDSGSYSQSIQTADTIYNEVSQIGGSLSSSIKQTAASIESEVRRYAGYYGICTSAASNNIYSVTLQNAPEINFNITNDLLQKGVGLAVRFTEKQDIFTTGSSGIKIKITDGSKDESGNVRYTDAEPIVLEGGNKFSWMEYSTIYFVYTESGWQVSDAGNYSRITQTANGIIADVKRQAQYYGTCNTGDSTVEGGSAKKDVTLINPLQPSDPESGSVKAIDLKDIYQTGVTIAVTFSSGETVTSIPTETSTTGTVDKDDTDNSFTYEYNKITYDTTGAALSLNIINSDITASETTRAWPIFVQNTTSGATEPFGWTAGSTIYFTFVKDRGWIVTDSGSFSKITQTADMIKAEVETLDGKYGSAITQTAKQIRLEVNQKANYTAECETSDGTSFKILTISDVKKLKKVLENTKVEVDCIILVHFTYANTKTTSGLTFKINGTNYEYSVTGSPKWEAGETLPFRLNRKANASTGSFTMTSLSNSSITETATAIIGAVQRTAGYGCIGTVDSNGILTAAIQNADNDNNFKPDTLNDIAQPGITLAVYISSDTTNKIRKLQYYFEGASSTKSTAVSIYRAGNVLSTTNELTFAKGDTIYLSYLDGKWIVVDSGGYSHITQTADAIRSEVASGLKYLGRCDTAAGTAAKTVSYYSGSSDEKFEAALKKGLTVGIEFSEGVSVSSGKTYLANATLNGKAIKYTYSGFNGETNKVTTTTVSGCPPCAVGGLLSFTYNGSGWDVSEEGSVSAIEQTATSINLKVQSVKDGVTNLETNTAGITGTKIERTGTGFNFVLDSDSFDLNTINNSNQATNVFTCNKNGIAVTGTITATGGTIGGWTLTKNSVGGYSLTAGNRGSSGFIGLWTLDPTSADSRLEIGNNFKVDKDGKITATAGNIGNWEIRQDWAAEKYSIFGYEYQKNGKYYGIGFRPYMLNYSLANNQDIPVFAIGELADNWYGDKKEGAAVGLGSQWNTKNADGSDKTKFYVTAKGVLHASNAVISGTITAKYINSPNLKILEDTNTIAGWTIASNKITSTDAKFQHSGFVGLYTSFNAGDGNKNSEGKTGNTHADVGGYIGDSWRFLIGSNFGIDKDGVVYVNQLYVPWYGEIIIEDGYEFQYATDEGPPATGHADVVIGRLGISARHGQLSTEDQVEFDWSQVFRILRKG